MNRIATFLNTAALILLGGFMLWLANSDVYWQLLNPQFKPLTGLTGAVAMLAGAATPFMRTTGRIPWSGALFMLAFLFISGTAVNEYLGDGSDELAMESHETEPRLAIGGTEYVKITVPELFMLAEIMPEKVPERFVLRGIVIRTPEMDAQNLVAVYRLAVVCCLADAVAAGMAVQVPDAAALEHGQWIRVAGHLAPAPELPPDPNIGPYLFTVNKKFIVTPEDLETLDMADVPYVFDMKQQEPFSY